MMKSEKKRVELRLDVDVNEGLRELAEKAAISVNQLCNGILRWAVANGHNGEGKIEPPGYCVTTLPQAGCLWFGYEPKEITCVDEYGEKQPGVTPPEICFQLDFTERRVIRED